MILKNIGLLITFFFSSLALAAPGFPSVPAQFVFKDFLFLPGHECGPGGFDPSFCEAAKPGRWSEKEYEILKIYLDPLYVGKLDRFRTQILGKGFSRLYRYGNGFRPIGNGKYVREPHGAWVWGRDLSINFSDFAFIPGFPPDPLSGFSVQSEAVLHEFAHAFSFNEPELMREFNQLVGWTQVGEDSWELVGASKLQVHQVVTRLRELMLAGKIEEALRLNRKYGVSHGFPTSYSMLNPDECFAEIAAHIYFDPRVEEYLKPEIIHWFREKVLK